MRMRCIYLYTHNIIAFPIYLYDFIRFVRFISYKMVMQLIELGEGRGRGRQRQRTGAHIVPHSDALLLFVMIIIIIICHTKHRPKPKGTLEK